ncbi:MAG: hypothetical protein COV55_05030 [Candidatus Komeilibacteria bacterium CG11_big_fil_rev_8_21_14_0_20_36_20]|uniref:ParB-like N-terminal domain-containing protein n=1 Tax=Candidatus Komeilibacteria bacterium CG11_big_fil_rev_8_21_14_0_20_36_20 TaxID=1974477 RepID=A0A2H0NAZ6_9BACT|nr:MAG: hypothetical protein COV55_05030 [Candidatus Komeilibacteria bacterium CG11_big_fil_rev_8_21_14_0_20_36_20]PIR82064.1 MAG: hypothetical protein COU21_00265 [Candidatus Komeilibacteria bacterium CG10_big_fil_rev_8_21_14_0_10_36_65]PJC55043.1 MAG: hypothetical protein CO027_04250 [Candidatus Komeilibacteria bacterium CG_4_9_14_0_2_um_filter_36_13]
MPLKLNEVKDILLSKIILNADQPRQTFLDETIKELAMSIKREGVLQPIIVRPALKKGSYEVVVGARRFRAAEIAGLKKIPAIITSFDDLKSYEIALIENIQREDLTIFEEAIAIFNLMKNSGHETVDAVSQCIGKSARFIRDRLKILQLPETIQKKVASKDINIGQAVIISKVPNRKDQEKVTKAVIANKLTTEETEALVMNKTVQLHRKLKIGDTLSPVKVLERLHALLTIVETSQWPVMDDETRLSVSELFDSLATSFKNLASDIRSNGVSDQSAIEMKEIINDIGKGYAAINLLFYLGEADKRIRQFVLTNYESKYQERLCVSLKQLAETLAARLERLPKKFFKQKRSKK